MPKMTEREAIKRYQRAHKLASAVLTQCQVGFPDSHDIHLLASQIFVSNITPSDSSAGNTDVDNSRDEVLRSVYEREGNQ